MFDDKNKDGGQTPNNLPIGEPDDIFSGVEKEEEPRQLAPEAPVEQAPEPATPSALGAGVLKPREAEPTPQVPRPEVEKVPLAGDQVPPADKMQDVYTVKEPTLTRGLITVVILVVVLAILGGGGWWIYSSFVPASSLELLEQAATPESVTAPVEEPAFVEFEEELVLPEEESLPEEEDIAADITDEQILFGEPIDKDADGLDDNREEDLGTDPNNWDSDGDGLGDGDEVTVWKTDPFVTDSDGDGYDDGEEVKNGYNPTGPGKIFEPPQS